MASTRCDDLEVRKDCARHLLVEDLGYFNGQVGGTPDHEELFRRIGDDLGYARDVYDRLVPVPEMAAPMFPVFRSLRRASLPFMMPTAAYANPMINAPDPAATKQRTVSSGAISPTATRRIRWFRSR